MRSVWPALAKADRSVARSRRAARRALGRGRAARIIGLDGWCSREHAILRARLVESSSYRLPGLLRRYSLATRAARLYRRYATREVPEVELEASYGDAHGMGVSDEEGFVILNVPAPASAPRCAQLSFTDSRATPVEIPVYRPSASAALLLVTDIDDTVLDTELSNPLRRVAQLLLNDEPTRLPFPGVGELYRALAGDEPVFYVSNSPLNLHGHLQELFATHDLPRGPLLLRDWGIHPAGIVPLTDATQHKKRALRQIAEDFPDTPLVLLGDSSRSDVEHYLHLAEQHRERVRAIYIRDVPGRLSRGIDHASVGGRAAELGVELLIADDTTAFAEHAASIGLITDDQMRAVRAARGVDEEAPDPVRKLVDDGSPDEVPE